MPTYTVTWSIDIDADSPLEAAHQALTIHRDPESTATVFTVHDPHTGAERSFDIDAYTQIALRLWLDPQWEPPITREEARTIAEGWASDGFCPKLLGWVNGADVPIDELITDAEELAENLCLNRCDWPYEGEPEPSIRAAFALVRFLEQQRGADTHP